MQSWIKKYAPEHPEDILGQAHAIAILDGFISGYKKQKKAALAYGPPGAGKTSTVYALAKKYGYEVVEVNASDVRNKEGMCSVVGAAMGQQSLFSKGKVILVDEVDGLSGTKDRGGIPAIVKLIANSTFPVVCTANNPFDKKFKALRKACELVAFDPPQASNAFQVLKRICEAEAVAYEEAALKMLVRKTGGDLRAAINDLQGISNLTSMVTMEALKELDDRNKVDRIEHALIKVFKNSDPDIALGAYRSLQEDLDEVALWVDYNLPKEYTKAADLVRAYECLSRADVYKGRIRRWQHWRFLSHINMLLSAGIATAKDEKYSGAPAYQQSKRLLQIWMANMKYQKRKAIAEKIADHTHCSTKRVIQDTLPYVRYVFRQNQGDSLAASFALDADEVSWLKK